MTLLAFFCLRDRVSDLLFTGLPPKYPQQLGLGQAKARNLELHSGFPCGWQGPDYWSHLCRPPWCALAESGARWVPQTRGCSVWDSGVPNSVLTTKPSACPESLSFDSRFVDA